MFEDHFGLDGSPFKLSPDPAYFYGSESHNKAMSYLHFGIRQAEGFIVITGPIGAGKSMIISHLIGQLDRTNIVAAQLMPTSIEASELIGQILSAFRIEAENDNRIGQLEAFEDYLFDTMRAGRRPLLIVDEAQNLSRDTLEELRMLSNLDYEGTPLIQVFLVGQPEFRDIIGADNMEQLRQRVIASYHLESLSSEETREYILHRLTVAGWRDRPIFSEDATTQIHDATGGRPRRINSLCNRIMMYCAMEKKDAVTVEIVERMQAELEEEHTPSKKAKKVKLAPAAKAAPSQALPPAKRIPPKITPEERQRAVHRADTTGNVVKIDSARNGKLKKAETPKVEKAVPQNDRGGSGGKKKQPVTKVENAAKPDPKKEAQVATTKESAQGERGNGVKEKVKETSPPPITVGTSSILDRLRGGGETSTVKTEPARQEATLTDVASAIADVDVKDKPAAKSAEQAKPQEQKPQALKQEAPKPAALKPDVSKSKTVAKAPEAPKAPKAPKANEAPQDKPAAKTEKIAAGGREVKIEKAKTPTPPAKKAEVKKSAAVDTKIEKSSRSQEGTEWKKSVVRSIGDTRNDMMQAHASVIRLQQSLDRMRNRRDESRKEIEKSLVRAQSLLDELKDVWR